MKSGELYRYSLKRERVGGVAEGARTSSPGDAVAFLRSIRLHEEEQECLVVLVVDARNNIRGYHEATRGLVDRSLGHPREVFRYAVINNASAIIMAHNHPSGELTPSLNDIELTDVIRGAGEIIGISLMDHIIIANEGYYSFVEEKLFED